MDKGNIICYNGYKLILIGGYRMKKRIVCLLLVLALAAGMVPAVSASGMV